MNKRKRKEFLKTIAPFIVVSVFVLIGSPFMKGMALGWMLGTIGTALMFLHLFTGQYVPTNMNREKVMDRMKELKQMSIAKDESGGVNYS